MNLPLRGYRIVDLTQNVAGPFCTQILADLGADVLKVEPVHDGDSTRQWAPPTWQSEAVMYLAFNRNKRSVAMDIRAPEGRNLLDRLLDDSDVLVHALRPSTARKLRLDPDSIHSDHPDVLVSGISAFGEVGPLTDEPGYDPVVQAFSGMMSVTGTQTMPPVRVGTSIIDMGAGLWSALSIIAALLSRERGGSISRAETSLLDTALAWLPYQIAGYLATGTEPKRWGSELAMLCPYGAYATRDHPIMIAVGKESLWHSFCDALQIPDLKENPHFATNPQRVRNREKLRAVLESRLHVHTSDYWMDRLRKYGVPASIVNSISEVLVHPQVQALDILEQSDHPFITNFRLIGLPIKLDGRRPKIRIHPPLLGEHTLSLLTEMGLSPKEIERLDSRGIIRIAENK